MLQLHENLFITARSYTCATSWHLTLNLLRYVCSIMHFTDLSAAHYSSNNELRTWSYRCCVTVCHSTFTASTFPTCSHLYILASAIVNADLQTDFLVWAMIDSARRLVTPDRNISRGRVRFPFKKLSPNEHFPKYESRKKWRTSKATITMQFDEISSENCWTLKPMELDVRHKPL